MIRNYLTIASRNLRKQKVSSSINVVGLGVGLMCCIFLVIWITDEFSYDQYHENGDLVYRILIEFPKSPRKLKTSAFTGPRTSIALKEKYPEIVESMRFKILGNIKPNIMVKRGNNTFNEKQVAFSDASIFKMFTHKFIKGDPENPLPTKNSIILSEKTADKYFPGEDPIGKTLVVENQYDYQVSAVIEDIPHNSHLQFEILVPFENITSVFTYYGEFLNSSGGPWFFRNYVMLQENTSLPALQEKVKNYYNELFENSSEARYLSLQSIKDIHLKSSLIRDNIKQGNLKYISIFSLIGLFVLFIACINNANLTTALAGQREKEIGMRKVIGAQRNNLVKQFFAESLVFSMAALVVALLLTCLLMPQFNNLAGKELHLGVVFQAETLLGIFGIVIVTGILSGIYPALYLSALKPVRILKGASSARKGGSLFRKITFVIQFVIAVGLIMCTVVVGNQFRYLQNKDLGFDRENFIYIPLYGQLMEKYKTAREEMIRNPNIPAATVSSSIMSQGAYATDFLSWEGMPGDRSQIGRMSFVSVEENYIETFNLEMVEGKSFTKHSTKGINEEIIINETAARMIGQENIVGLGARVPGPNPGTIIGIVKDYNFSSLHSEIGPLVISIEPPVFRYLLVKIKQDEMQSSLKHIEEICKSLEPGFPFEFHFMDEAFESLYRTEMKMSNLISSFTYIAILIACLGMFGLSSFSASRRTKEVGVRKVLGASIPDIIGLLTREYLVLITTAIVIAWPIAYYFMEKWLQSFAYRTSLSFSIFILSGLAALVIALLTVSYQTIKAATANPVESLRYE